MATGSKSNSDRRGQNRRDNDRRNNDNRRNADDRRAQAIKDSASAEQKSIVVPIVSKAKRFFKLYR